MLLRDGQSRGHGSTSTPGAGVCVFFVPTPPFLGPSTVSTLDEAAGRFLMLTRDRCFVLVSLSLDIAFKVTLVCLFVVPQLGFPGPRWKLI